MGLLRTPSRWTTAVAAALLCGCGGLDNASLRYGDVVGRVLRAQPDSGLVVVMGRGLAPVPLEGDGSFHLASLPVGAEELLVVAGPDEALRVPVTVRPAEVTDLSEVDPLPAAFIVINLTTQGQVADCWVKVARTHLTEVHAPDGSYDFTVGPLAAGCYHASMEHDGQEFWSDPEVCLRAGERRAFDVAW